MRNTKRKPHNRTHTAPTGKILKSRLQNPEVEELKKTYGAKFISCITENDIEYEEYKFPSVYNAWKFLDALKNLEKGN